MSYILKKYGQSANLHFPLIQRDVKDFSGGLSFSAGDVQISKDRAAFSNSTNLPIDEGLGFYSLALTSGEMDCANLMVSIKDQSAPKLFEDTALIVDTYGHSSAEHAFDLDSPAVFLLANQNFSNSGDAAYYADIEFNPDDNSGKDEYTVRWYKNSNLVTTGVTGSTVTLLKRSDGTNVFTSASMTQVGSTAMYKYDATASNRINHNESYEISTSATIDSAVRTWAKIIWR